MTGSEKFQLEKWLRESENIVFVTGKDFSAAAGFPDYRAMDDAFLKTYRYPPEEILDAVFVQQYPFFFYKYFREKIMAPLLEAKPGAAHDFLARLEEAGKLKAILTVNIDGIHQEAGSREVLELHGSVMRNWCSKCEKFLDFTYILDSPTPIAYCNVDMCGDFVRPAIVLREEPYDFALIQKAMDYVKAADVLVIDASAMKEFPVPNLFRAFEGHKLILLNPPPMVFDSRAGLVVNGDVNEIFSQVELETEKEKL